MQRRKNGMTHKHIQNEQLQHFFSSPKMGCSIMNQQTI